MEIQFKFEELRVYQLAREYTKHIYKLTERLPKDERFGIISQMRRSSSSVMTNIAEGAYRISGKEQARFTEYAYSSLMETVSWGITCFDQKYISQEELSDIKLKAKDLGVKLSNYYKSQKKVN